MKQSRDIPADNVGDNYGILDDLQGINDKILKYKKAPIEWFEEKPPKINLKKVFFREYALFRFRIRFPNFLSGYTDFESIEKIARDLISKANEESLSNRLRLERLLNNGCQEVRYYRLGEIRFVVDAKGENDVHTVLTVEKYEKFVEYKSNPH